MHHLNEIERKTLVDVFNRHLGAEYPADIILFGSMLTGKYKLTSDIDIAVKFKEPLDKAVWAKIEEDFENSLLSRKVDVVDYWRVTPEFRKIIDSQGQVLCSIGRT